MDHMTDSWLYLVTALAAMEPPHDHLLRIDPRRLGWRCQVEGCDFFKAACEFNGMQAAM